MEKYGWIREIGQGSFSYVYLAENIMTGQLVAIKAMKHQLTDSQKMAQIRQIRMLQKLRHPNIIKLLDRIVHNNKLYLVFQFMDNNVYDYYLDNLTYHNTKKQRQILQKQQAIEQFKSKGVNRNKERSTRERENEQEIPQFIPTNIIKQIMVQIVLAMENMHQQNVFHRDLKPENVLIKFPQPNQLEEKRQASIQVKIADFGLAREIPQSQEPITGYISTRWYRAPELVVKMKNYNEAVDVFALGCIMGELYNSKPLFPGQNIIEHLQLQIAYLGVPEELEWPQFYNWCNRKGYELPKTTRIKRKIIQRPQNLADPEAQDLIQQLLQFNPKKRIKTSKILDHPYFQTGLDYYVELTQRRQNKAKYHHRFLQYAKNTKTQKLQRNKNIFHHKKRELKGNAHMGQSKEQKKDSSNKLPKMERKNPCKNINAEYYDGFMINSTNKKQLKLRAMKSLTSLSPHFPKAILLNVQDSEDSQKVKIKQQAPSIHQNIPIMKETRKMSIESSNSRLSHQNKGIRHRLSNIVKIKSLSQDKGSHGSSKSGHKISPYRNIFNSLSGSFSDHKLIAQPQQNKKVRQYLKQYSISKNLVNDHQRKSYKRDSFKSQKSPAKGLLRGQKTNRIRSHKNLQYKYSRIKKQGQNIKKYSDNPYLM